MTEILLVSLHRCEAEQRRGSISGGFARGISPLHGFFLNSRQNWYIFRAFFLNFVCISLIKIKPKTKILWPSLVTE